MTFRKRIIWGIAILTVFAAFTACGGGDGSSNDDTDTDEDTGSNGQTGSTVVLAANDLGMHCMDREFSVFSILPPFNAIHAQVVNRSSTGIPELLDDTTVNLYYDGISDANGSINTYSATGALTKTDFWQWADQLFGAGLNPGEGLTGLYMPGDAPQGSTPQSMAFDAAEQWFVAEGIPITPVDDSGDTNPFGLMRILARDTGGQQVGYLDVVVPVATETDCQICHGTGGIAAQGTGWSNNPDLEVQSKINILRLHDNEEQTNLENSQPVLCAECHYSPPLDLSGAGPANSLPTFSEAVHAYHAGLRDSQDQPVFAADVENNCYQCHPGRLTKCHRGVMATGGMDCFDCHGDLAAVGGQAPLQTGGSIDGTNDGASRRSWQDLPRCQSCHTGDAVVYLANGDNLVRDGQWPFRLRQTYQTGDTSASPLAVPDSRFAENTHTLYRFSKGHGGIFCEGCHGSTHAVWPAGEEYVNDNAAALNLQGFNGVIRNCGVCHPSGTLPLTTNGPHGLHNIADARWYSEDGHGDRYERDQDACKACHGNDLSGTPLAKIPVARTFKAEEHTVTFAPGDLVGCTHCHERPELHPDS